MNKLLVLGATSFSTEVADVAEAAGWVTVGFVENQDRSRADRTLDGRPVHWVDHIAGLAGDHWVVCGLGTTTRERFGEQARRMGFRAATIVHPSATVSPRAELGPGCIVSAGSVIAAFAVLDEHVLVNRGALIGHHSSVGRYSTIGPGVNVAGSCRVGKAAYLGMSSVVLNNLTVGEGSIIGSGAVVISDVPARALVMGVPAEIRQHEIDPK